MVSETSHGKWIWLSPRDGQVEQYLFFRREFPLSEMPASAELGITARTLFHVFINGRHVGFGPNAWPNGLGGVCSLIEANYFLQTGRNVIAVLVHNTAVPCTGRCRQPGGLWCELSLNGKSYVWTDETWSVLRGECYRSNRPRRSPHAGFTENVDMREYPQGWTDESFDAESWGVPDVVESVTPQGPLQPERTPEIISRYEGVRAVLASGAMQQWCAVAPLCLADCGDPWEQGVFAARGFFHGDAAGTMPIRLFADNPYRLFVNHELAREQGVAAPACGELMERMNPLPYGQAGISPVEGALSLRKGWNEIVVFERTERNAAGMTLLFHSIEPEGVGFRSAPAPDADPGWNVYGPLRTPLAHAYAGLDFERLSARGVVPVLSLNTHDEALLHAFRFHATPKAKGEGSRANRQLRSWQYVVYDLGQTLFGVPAINLSANNGDVLHVVTAEALDAEQTIPALRRGTRQDVETLTTNSHTTEWIGCEPRTFRYVMVAAREVESVVTVHAAGLYLTDLVFSTPGSFSCDDERLNRIWASGERTLRATVRGQLVDSPAGRKEQTVPGAMVQSLSAYPVFGAYDLAGKCVADFAESQYETGEILPVFPSSRYIRQPQFSLFWPIWLYQHYMYSGNRELAERLMPNLDEFLVYLSMHAADDGLLSGLDDDCNLRDFVDWRPPPAGTVSTALNALYCRVLFASARFFRLLGEEGAADELLHRARTVGRSIRALCWDEENEQFADYAEDGRACEVVSWVSNVMALYGGIVPQESVESVFARFVEKRSVRTLGCTPQFKHILLDAALLAAYREWAYDHLVEYWGGMLDKGADTWWAKYDPSLNGPMDGVPLCCGAGAVPNAFLTAEIVGLRPAAPGFTAAYFNPLVKGPSAIAARIPTAHGHVDVQWKTENGEMNAHIHATYPLDLIPMLAPELEEKTTLHVSDNVALLLSGEESGRA